MRHICWCSLDENSHEQPGLYGLVEDLNHGLGASKSFPILTPTLSVKQLQLDFHVEYSEAMLLWMRVFPTLRRSSIYTMIFAVRATPGLTEMSGYHC